MYEMVLQIILHEDIHLLADNEVEKQLQTAPYLKSVRLDVFGVDEESVVYNTEMQKIRKSDLRKRSRFYQGLLDSGLLATGTPNYNLLNDSYIIMITPFDLFGLGLYQYTFRAVCEEEPGLKLGDGATRIFLNTKGTNPEDVESCWNAVEETKRVVDEYIKNHPLQNRRGILDLGVFSCF